MALRRVPRRGHAQLLRGGGGGRRRDHVEGRRQRLAEVSRAGLLRRGRPLEQAARTPVRRWLARSMGPRVSRAPRRRTTWVLILCTWTPMYTDSVPPRASSVVLQRGREA